MKKIKINILVFCQIFACIFLISVNGICASTYFPGNNPTSSSDDNIGLPENTVQSIRMMSPEQQQKYFYYLLKHGVYANLPGFWKIMQSPDDIFLAVHNFGEPFNPSMLDALERALPKLKDEEQQIQVACWLYRYDRSAGYQFLVQSLSEVSPPRLDAAATLALNHDKKSKKLIIALCINNINSSNELISDLGDWHEDDIKIALLSAFRSNPHNPHLALALAKQNVQEALPLISELYFGSTNNSITKIYAGVSLVSLARPQTPQVFDFLVSIIQKPTSPALELRTIQAFGQTKEQRIVPVLIKVVDTYNLHSVHRNMNGEALSESQIAVTSAEALAKIGAVHSRSSVVKLLGTLKKSGADDSLYIRAAKAALDLGANPIMIGKTMGMSRVRAEIYKKSLKSIPSDLLPEN